MQRSAGSKHMESLSASTPIMKPKNVGKLLPRGHSLIVKLSQPRYRTAKAVDPFGQLSLGQESGAPNLPTAKENIFRKRLSRGTEQAHRLMRPLSSAGPGSTNSSQALATNSFTVLDCEI